MNVYAWLDKELTSRGWQIECSQCNCYIHKQSTHKVEPLFSDRLNVLDKDHKEVDLLEVNDFDKLDRYLDLK